MTEAMQTYYDAAMAQKLPSWPPLMVVLLCWSKRPYRFGRVRKELARELKNKTTKRCNARDARRPLLKPVCTRAGPTQRGATNRNDDSSNSAWEEEAPLSGPRNHSSHTADSPLGAKELPTTGIKSDALVIARPTAQGQRPQRQRNKRRRTQAGNRSTKHRPNKVVSCTGTTDNYLRYQRNRTIIETPASKEQQGANRTNHCSTIEGARCPRLSQETLVDIQAELRREHRERNTGKPKHRLPLATKCTPQASRHKARNDK